MLYVTLGDQPSGVYEGQVIDVCHFLSHNLKAKVRLVAFISIREFRLNKMKIKRSYPGAIVLPMFPKLQNWQLNVFMLALVCLFTGERVVICRNVLATNIALSLKKIGLLNKVCYDGRGAIAAEWEEYEVVEEESLKAGIAKYERAAVLASDYRIAVSSKLVSYWGERYEYASQAHAVIPCTLSSHFELELRSEEDIAFFRNELGYQQDDIVLVYSGSTAGWQSFNLLKSFLLPILDSCLNMKVIFLSKSDENNLFLQEQYPKQVSIKWVSPGEVNKYLAIADYGILIRENTVTNQVASPTKFAEYLISGLGVIISPELGDYTQFVLKNSCGIVTNGEVALDLKVLAYSDRGRSNELAKQHFLKSSPNNLQQYTRLIQTLDN
ncbi:glycosyltransferase family protein [Pontibacter burrus]|uniref:Glycosyltransferase family 4 protein n=1 Tax=Pontibacter burrus TaxID=2704466 RepID=A0A6B3LZ26_9BACT|nr:glycosyltransferase family 4 protein [Pontibacter burrus]NEM98890.1 glycosyltransferase family 4 protein [Pontibacter burrus]